jgi:hypothetical protein
MFQCPNCGAEWIADAVTCILCGSGPQLALPVGAPALAPERSCPACGKRFPADYHDSFCSCGVELTAAPGAPPVEVPPMATPVTAELPAVRRPRAGTRCLVLYGSDRRPARYFPLTQDVTLIGRVDVVQGSFPDIDVEACVEPAVARKVSRRHAMVLHSRADDRYVLRPLGGNTGTQVEVDMVPALSDYPLTPGIRIILGGAVRLKFEIT